MVRRALLAVVALLALCSTVPACDRGRSAGGSDAGPKTLTIAVIPKGTTHEFWKSVHAGAVKASRELGVQIVWKGPLKEDDLKGQIDVVQSFTAQGVSGIVVAPLSDKGLTNPVRAAAQAKIPVVVFDSDLAGKDHVSFVATDNRAAGRMAGEHLAKLLGGKGKVVLLRYQEGSASTTHREQGFVEAIKANAGIQVVSDNQFGGATTESAFSTSETLLSAQKAGEGGVDGIFCPNESTTFGMLLALQKLGLAGKIKLVGFDSSEKLVQGLAAGQLDGLVLQNPFNIGYLAVKTMVRHLRGEKVEERIDTGAQLVTQSNMNEPAVKELLQPDLGKWLDPWVKSAALPSTGDAGAGAPRLSLTGLRKAFGPTVALAGVDLEVRAGEVHALIGENGAGKSTLIHVLAGALYPDQGAVTLDGAPYRPSGPAAARASGVAIVHQELSLCPQLTVAANVLLGAEPARYGLLRAAEEEARAAEVLAELGPAGRALSPRALVADLSPPARQLVEIARALALPGVRLLLLDEPTSSLAAHDVDRLIELTRSLAARGVAVLYVSHFLEEVRRVADRYTVLRDGRAVGSGAMADADTNELVARMAGRRVEALYPRSPREAGEVLLEVRGLAGARRPEDASFTLRRGEVLGVAGLMGAGRTELVRAIFGLDPVVRGTVRVRAFVGPASPSRRLAQGVGMLSEDRKSEGLAAALSVADNMTLSRLDSLGPLGLVFPTRQRAAAAELIHRLGVRCSGPDQVVSDLSGGNQQKVALARLLHHDVDVLLLDEPTRGIDVASKSQIYELVDELAARGKAVLLVSSYLPELLGVCDRIAVMRRGVLGGAHPASELTEHDLLMEATGG